MNPSSSSTTILLVFPILISGLLIACNPESTVTKESPTHTLLLLEKDRLQLDIQKRFMHNPSQFNEVYQAMKKAKSLLEDGAFYAWYQKKTFEGLSIDTTEMQSQDLNLLSYVFYLHKIRTERIDKLYQFDSLDVLAELTSPASGLNRGDTFEVNLRVKPYWKWINPPITSKAIYQGDTLESEIWYDQGNYQVRTPVSGKGNYELIYSFGAPTPFGFDTLPEKRQIITLE
ncbi:hypothetical protein KFE98_14630 [bacterium SCSIO 12741]|nr:hypothetical protein KFE98_14630 [bacterium SCSIO 12741]